MYTGYGGPRVPATEPIVQHAQFDAFHQVLEPEQNQSNDPFTVPNSGLRHRSPYSAYYTSPIVPPQPSMGAGSFLNRSDIYGYPQERTSITQPHQDDWEDDEEKYHLANYHAQADWDPEDEYDDPEPNIATRRPYSDTTLPGYRPPAQFAHPNSLSLDGNTHPQTIITVGSETTRKHFINKNICPPEQRRSFILVLAKALLQFQAPSHRIENQLEAAARVLDVPAEFLHLPSLVIVSFGSTDGENGAPTTDKPRKFSFSSNKLKSAIAMAVLGRPKREIAHSQDQQGEVSVPEPMREGPLNKNTFGIQVHIIKSGGKMELGKLHELHKIYRKVVHDEISAQDGRMKLLKLLKQPPIYSIYERCVHAFLCGLLICVISFGGSFVDMWVAGAGCATIAYLQLGVASGNPLYYNIFEISAAMMMSFVARGLSSINGHLFCYSAISSASVVLILPGSIVLSSSLELASRSLVSGSVKLVYAIVYSLFLGFSLTIGSDLYYLVDQSARPRIAAGMANITDSYDLPGIFTDDNGQVVFSGAFTFLKPAASVTNTVKYVSKGCTRRYHIIHVETSALPKQAASGHGLYQLLFLCSQ
ncbi:Pheromone-regulated membrane protein 10 [Rhizoctonia solani AG-1 IB]|uniref:Pheromone-regulated membrane protein 10 n=1 Tax=Thanatephorus cucumeris (strain AG1-IB / isolate 7/3/14) TaxID=1108050 RepID=M5BVY5_THACB|nr:Pheromone-regulated membrane protein 10 [Rhizoctonia solani AG-1 IB]